MIADRLRRWWAFLRKHPYADSFVVLVVLVLAGGGVRWWSRPAVQLSVDGITRTLHPSAQTVGEVLAQEKIVLGPMDFVTPASETALERNGRIHITRVTQRRETVIKTQKPKIYARTRLKANLRPVLVERGFVQIDSQTVLSTYYDGVKTDEKVVKQKTIRRPVFTLTLFDKKTGRPAKVYDLIKAEKMSMRATGYYVGEKYVPSDTTFLGYKLRRGLVAVDPKVIPLRTRLYVKGYGYAYAADTGSAIKGNRIDLAVKDRKEEAKFNRHNVPVYILEKAKSW